MLSTTIATKESRLFNQLFSIHSIHCTYSYHYSYDDLSLIDNNFRGERVIDLHNNDMFVGENFFNEVIVCHGWI